MFLEWIPKHRFLLGVLADTLSFLGGAALVRDALHRLSDLRRTRIDAQFRKVYGNLHVSDEELSAAVLSLRWTIVGFTLICLGFLCQLALRLGE